MVRLEATRWTQELYPLTFRQSHIAAELWVWIPYHMQLSDKASSPPYVERDEDEKEGKREQREEWGREEEGREKRKERRGRKREEEGEKRKEERERRGRKRGEEGEKRKEGEKSKIPSHCNTQHQLLKL